MSGTQQSSAGGEEGMVKENCPCHPSCASFKNDFVAWTVQAKVKNQIKVPPC